MTTLRFENGQQPTTRPKARLVAGELVIGEAHWTDDGHVILYWHVGPKMEPNRREIEVTTQAQLDFRSTQSPFLVVPVDQPAEAIAC